MAPPTGRAADALLALSSCALKELHLKRADGTRMLDVLYSTCKASGLIPAGAVHNTPTERYMAVFDAALNSCLGSWVLDYVEVVCADRHLTSNDPLEAYLLDGGFVRAWAQGRLTLAEAALAAALQPADSFRSFVDAKLQAHLAQARVLVTVLKALDLIRAGAAAPGGTALAAAAGAGSGQDRFSVKTELRQAVLLEQAFQVLDWCARHGLHERASHTGRYGSYAEWSTSVTRRRSRAAPRQLFLDTLLEALSLPGSYPFGSIQHILNTLLLVVREVEAPAWHAKLALLTYYLLDAGLLDGPAGGGAGAAAGAGSGSGSEAALEDLRCAFRLSSADVGTWQCAYLLDCAAPDQPDDPFLARACALLPACVKPSTPFAFIEALLALGRPDVALAVDRGQAPTGSSSTGLLGLAAEQAGSSAGRPCRTLAQATTLLTTRLRCGLMTEAFLLLRQHATDLATHGSAPSEVEEHTRSLLCQLAAWAAEHSSTTEPWLNRLTELPLNALEETVLVGWLAAEAEAGRPAGDFFPLFFLQRGRVNEAVAAWRRWEARQTALASAGHRRSPVSDLISAALDAAHAGLPLPLRNVSVPGDSTAPLGELLTQGAIGVLAGLVDHSNPEVPAAELPFHGAAVPPLISRAVPLPPASAGPAPGSRGGHDALPGSKGALAGTGQDASYAVAATERPDGSQQQQQQTFAMLPLLPGSAPFSAPMGAAGMDAFRPGSTFGVGAGGSVGGLLFSVGTGAVAAGGAAAGGAGWPATTTRTSKRTKPNDWLL